MSLVFCIMMARRCDDDFRMWREPCIMASYFNWELRNLSVKELKELRVQVVSLEKESKALKNQNIDLINNVENLRKN